VNLSIKEVHNVYIGVSNKHKKNNNIKRSFKHKLASLKKFVDIPGTIRKKETDNKLGIKVIEYS
jgi:hypothetical protein